MTVAGATPSSRAICRKAEQEIDRWKIVARRSGRLSQYEVWKDWKLKETPHVKQR
jgi:hypothetical protein